MKGTLRIKGTEKCARTIFVIGAATLWLSSPAHAYLNPGTGSILAQMLLSSFVGLAIVLKLYWAQIKKTFQKLFFKNRD